MPAKGKERPRKEAMTINNHNHYLMFCMALSSTFVLPHVCRALSSEVCATAGNHMMDGATALHG